MMAGARVRGRGSNPRGNRSARRLRIPLQGTIALRVGYAAVIALATLADVDVLATSDAAHSFEEAFQPALSPRAVADAIRNVVLFAGWGAVWVATAPVSAPLLALWNATVTGALLSVLVETLQLLAPERQPSILDVIANTGGAAFGALAIGLAVSAARRRREARSFVGVPAFLFAGPYLLGVLLESFGSFLRLERLAGVWGAPVDRLRAALGRLEPASASVLPWFDVVLFAPAGAFAVAALVELGLSYRAAAVVAAFVGVPAVALAEFARGFAGYPIELGPIIVHAVAVVLGAVAAAAILPGLTKRARGRARPLALFVAYCLLVALWSWRPFHPEFDLSQVAAKFTVDRFIPLQAYRDRVDLFTAVDVMLSFLLFLPLGALLAVWPLRLRGPLRSFLPGIYLAAGLELSQLLLTGRWFDITDALVHAAAVLLGWIIVRRAGFAPYGQMVPTSIAPAAGPPP